MPLSVKTSSVIQKRFEMSDADVRYDELPAWMADKIGFVAEWEGGQDVALLPTIDDLAKSSQLFTILAGEMRIVASRHFYYQITVAAEDAITSKNIPEGLRIISEIKNNLLGYMVSEDEEAAARKLIGHLNSNLSPRLDKVPPTVSNIQKILSKAGRPVNTSTRKAACMEAYAEYCSIYDIPNILKV